MQIYLSAIFCFLLLISYQTARAEKLSHDQELLRDKELLSAPAHNAAPINQRRAYGNACGPASLLNAFQYGTGKWRRVFDAIPGTNSRTRIRYVVSTWGNKKSNYVENRNRWNRKEGINLLDLTDMANEMRKGHLTASVNNHVLTQQGKETRNNLLRRSHKLISKSLNNGLPPIISISRFAHRHNDLVGTKTWWPIRAHFVVIITVPKKLAPDAVAFPVTYIDPYGGFTRTGYIRANPGDFTNNPFLNADFPHAQVGKSLVKKGEKTVISMSSIIGHW